MVYLLVHRVVHLVVNLENTRRYFSVLPKSGMLKILKTFGSGAVTSVLVGCRGWGWRKARNSMSVLLYICPPANGTRWQRFHKNIYIVDEIYQDLLMNEYIFDVSYY